jgi:hypothetical protein
VLATTKSQVPDESGNYKNLKKEMVLYEIMRRTILISNFLRLIGELFGLPTYWREPLGKISAELK